MLSTNDEVYCSQMQDKSRYLFIALVDMRSSNSTNVTETPTRLEGKAGQQLVDRLGQKGMCFPRQQSTSSVKYAFRDFCADKP